MIALFVVLIPYLIALVWGSMLALGEEIEKTRWLHILGLLSVLLAGISLCDNNHNKTASSNADKPPPSTTFSLSDRARQNPPLVYELADGEAWLVAAIERQGEKTDLIIRFKHKNAGVQILKSGASKALAFVSSFLCGTDGIFQTHNLSAMTTSLVVYENANYLGNISLPKSFCSA